MTYGFGTQSCGFWVAEEKKDSSRYRGMQHWFTGFVTGIGYSGVFELKETDSSAMGLFVTNYCNENPLDDVSDGARALVQALKK
jgi:hypothetical protein